MLSPAVTALLFAVILFIAGCFIASVWRERQRYLAAQAKYPIHPLDRHVKVILHLQDGVVVGAEAPTQQSLFTLPPTWYKRRRTLVSLGLLLLLLLMLCVQGGLLRDTLRNLGISLFGDTQATSVQVVNQAIQYQNYNASQRLVRLYQLDPSQYDSPDDYNTWAYSACSTASLAEVFNAYGYHLRIADVLKVEAQIGAITPSLGLVDPSGIARTAALFGFTTNWGMNWTLDQVINTANSGKPVIVDWPPDRYDGGHILVVTGGDANYVYLADSSRWNRQSLTRDQFSQWWEGFAAVLTPR